MKSKLIKLLILSVTASFLSCGSDEGVVSKNKDDQLRDQILNYWFSESSYNFDYRQTKNVRDIGQQEFKDLFPVESVTSWFKDFVSDYADEQEGYDWNFTKQWVTFETIEKGHQNATGELPSIEMTCVLVVKNILDEQTQRELLNISVSNCKRSTSVLANIARQIEREKTVARDVIATY